MNDYGANFWRKKSNLVLSECSDSYSYRRAMIMLLKESITYDAYCCTVVDPLTLCSIGAVTEHSIEDIHHQLLGFEYGETDVYPYEEMLQKGMLVGRLSDSLGILTSKRYEEVLKPHQFTDELRCTLVFQGRCYGYLTLFKKQRITDSYFTDVDVACLKVLAPIMGEALQSFYLSIIEKQHIENEFDQGVMILDHRLNILSLNAKASHLLTLLRNSEGIPTDYLPKPLQVLCTKLLANNERPISLFVPIQQQGYIVIQVSSLHSSQNDQMQIAISLNNATPKDMLLYLMKAYHLTQREQEVVLEVIKGSPTKEIAHNLTISYHTAQDYLKAIFQKVQVSNRNELVWKVFSRFQFDS